MKNAERFERVWEEEKRRCQKINEDKKSKQEKHVRPSLSRAAWQFGRTRFIVCLVLVVISMFLQFAGPVSKIPSRI